MKNIGCLGCIAGWILGVVFAYWYVYSFTPKPTQGCGMDQGFGFMGLAMMTSFFGCILGTIIGAHIKME